MSFVRDVMHIGVPTCREETPLPEAVRRLLQENVEALIVLDENGNAVGRFGRPQAAAAYASASWQDRPWGAQTVAQVMRPDIPEIPPDIPAPVAAQLMLDQGERELYLLHRSSGLCWPAATLRLSDLLADLVGAPLPRRGEGAG